MFSKSKVTLTVLFLIALSIIVPVVSAVCPGGPENYTSHVQFPLNKFQGYLYANQTFDLISLEEANAVCIANLGSTGYAYERSGYAGTSSTGTFGQFAYWGLSLPLTVTNSGTPAVQQCGAVYVQQITCRKVPLAQGIYYNKWWINYASINAPIYYYPNVTVTVFSATTGMTIPRAAIDLSSTDPTGAWTDHSYTDLYGTYTLNLVEGFINTTSQISANLTVSKVGYNTTTFRFNVTSNDDINLQILLDDAIWNQSGSNAIVYLDVAEEADNSTPIFDATIGIKNTTSDVNSWWYSTYPDSTIAFTTSDGSINLSVGQTIEFAGYKTGSYAAGHTDPITLTAPVSRMTLLLTKSDVVPVITINGSPYYPVTITDAVTGNAISGSWLNVDGSVDFTGWYNRSSATGKFNITGKGTSGSIPLVAGDILTLEGNATGYVNNGFALLVANSSSGILQTINLIPTGYAAISGEFTAIVNVYDTGSTAAISGASVNIQKGNYSLTKSTLSSGVATFKNLTAGDSYSLTVSKSGYTTITKTFTGGSGAVVSLDIPMSSGSVNPTVTSTITPVPSVTLTNVPTTSSTTGGYTGFWGPLYDFFSSMGAAPGQLNLLMAGMFVFAGVIIGGFGTGTIFPGANALNVSGALVGGIMGFMAASMFGFINPLYLVVLAIFGIFIYFFTR